VLGCLICHVLRKLHNFICKKTINFVAITKQIWFEQ